MEPRPRPTMRDVAALAGVSLKTVSRVVNREPGVSGDLQGRVRRAAQQLDFRLNMTASNLRRAGQRTATIGLLVEDVGNPFFAAIHRGVEDIAGPLDVGVFSASLEEDQERERRLIQAFAARRVDGVILSPTGAEHGYLINEIRAGLPMVFVDRAPRGVEGDLVLTDNRAYARAATEHLLARGHRSIGFLGGTFTLQTAQERYQGFVDAMTAADVSIEPALVARDLRSVEQAEAATERILREHPQPTALFTAQNLLSTGAIRALNRRGLQHRVAMVGFDDFEFADVLSPAVTVIAQDPRRLGQVAAELLFARIAEPELQAQISLVASHLVQRGSGEIRPAS
jgi:LacI family transcriptional regulator